MGISPEDFGASFKGFLEQMSSAAPVDEPVFRRRLREHFEREPNELPTLTEKFPSYDHANIHLADESELSGTDRSVETFGVINPQPYMSATLSMLVAPARSGLMGGGELSEGPVEYVNITLGDDLVLACINSNNATMTANWATVQNGLFLAKRGGEPLAILMAGPAKEFHPMPQVSIQVMARNRDAAETVSLRTAMRVKRSLAARFL